MNTGAVGRIHQLPPEIAAKLRAGEVVSKPFNAIKELMENSLDAGCTTLKIDVSGYGFKQITITDDGCGINKDDMILLCECHATSKLKSIEDLLDIRTFGFRGEALSSISNVAHVSVITQTSDSPCAYKANYHMQKMRETSPQAVAGKKGTTIIIQDLFFTVPAKRKTFTKPKDDFGEIKDVVGCYALHYPKVSFVLKQAEAKVAEINTPVGGTTLANITALYGRHVTESLLPVSLNADFASLQVEGFISNGNYAGAKSQYIFFVNHRLVEMASFKTATEQAYASTFPKHGKMHPFVYLSVTVAPQNVDVNVDCAKSRVKVLHDTRVAEALNVRIATMLEEWEKTRSDLEREKEVELLKEREAKQAKKKAGTANVQRELVPASPAKPSPRKQGHPLALPIWATLAQNGSLAAGKVLQNNVFIGVVDPLHSLIVSDQNVVYSVNHTGVFELIASQYVLRQLGALATSSIPLAQPLPLADLFMVALESPRSGYDASADGPAAVRVLEMVQFLVQKAHWLQTWFGLEIEASTHRLLKVPRDPLGNVPELSTLPLMLLSLCYDVNWVPLCEDPESDAAASQVIYECARVALGPWMAPGLDRFCPQPIALETTCAAAAAATTTTTTGVEEHNEGGGRSVSSQPSSAVGACKSISPAQCLWKAAELGSEYFVWLKNSGVMARVYFVMRAPELFDQLERIAPEGEERVFQAIVHPARRIKFVATLALGTVVELSRRDHIRKLQAIATAQWIHENGGKTLNLDALEAGWNVLASEDCSHVMLVNGYMVFDDVRMLHGFVSRCHERLLQTHWDMCRFPFFQRVKELSDLPIAFAKHGKFLMRPLYGPPEDNLKVFLRCLPHMLLQEDPMQEERSPKSRAVMPVDARSSVHTIVKEWFAYATRWSTYISDDEFRANFVNAQHGLL